MQEHLQRIQQHREQELRRRREELQLQFLPLRYNEGESSMRIRRPQKGGIFKTLQDDDRTVKRGEASEVNRNAVEEFGEETLPTSSDANVNGVEESGTSSENVITNRL